mmetsp:Transcript_29/g.43  ORF Transcript_29/g.43 Transcript_29/m.43 type:complete len:97 (+) Transcript_29:928-1218(+)
MDDMTRKSQLKRYFLRLLVVFFMFLPFAIVLLSYTLSIDFDLDDCSARTNQPISFALRLTISTLSFLVVFAFLDKICLKANLFAAAPTIDGIGYQD